MGSQTTKGKIPGPGTMVPKVLYNLLVALRKAAAPDSSSPGGPTIWPQAKAARAAQVQLPGAQPGRAARPLPSARLLAMLTVTRGRLKSSHPSAWPPRMGAGIPTSPW